MIRFKISQVESCDIKQTFHVWKGRSTLEGMQFSFRIGNWNMFTCETPLSRGNWHSKFLHGSTQNTFYNALQHTCTVEANPLATTIPCAIATITIAITLVTITNATTTIAIITNITVLPPLTPPIPSSKQLPSPSLPPLCYHH